MKIGRAVSRDTDLTEISRTRSRRMPVKDASEEKGNNYKDIIDGILQIGTSTTGHDKGAKAGHKSAPTDGKVTKGIISANRGLGDDRGQFQMDAAVQPGNSGGPVYDANGNIVGVVVAQLNKLKFAKAIGSLPENVNFGIKAVHRQAVPDLLWAAYKVVSEVT